MVNIRIFVHGDEENPSYEGYPYILTVSRVPCVGEDIHSNGSTEGGVKRSPGIYKVTDVMHYTNTLDLAASAVPRNDVSPMWGGYKYPGAR